MKLEIVGKAVPSIRYPQNVLIMPEAQAPEAAGPTPDGQPSFSVDFAATTSAELATWLAETINWVLNGEPPLQSRPAGTVVEHGQFHPVGASVCARDWRVWGDEIELVRCADEETARGLADRLNSLLPTGEPSWEA